VDIEASAYASERKGSVIVCKLSVCAFLIDQSLELFEIASSQANSHTKHRKMTRERH